MVSVYRPFNNFTGREQALKSILRYSLYKPVYYRSSVYDHSLRVSWMIQALQPIIASASPLDHERCVMLALIHDDIEMVIGDIQMGNKARMTREQLADVARQEQEAINVLEQRFPKTLGGYDYAQLLHEAIDVQTPEAKLMKYADKFDGFCEALHELYAGNAAMTINVVNEYGTIPTPYEYYIPFFRQYHADHPEFSFNHTHPFFQPPEEINVNLIAERGSLHTEGSIQELVSHPQYDWWKRVVLEQADQQQQKFYSTQKEL